jgi:hypothetical protein
VEVEWVLSKQPLTPEPNMSVKQLKTKIGWFAKGGNFAKKLPPPKAFTCEKRIRVPGGAQGLLGAINLALIGHENCNVVNKDGVLVTRPGVTKDQERKLQSAHHTANMTQEVVLLITYSLETGEIVKVDVKPRS